jgi:hypothetical protein
VRDTKRIGVANQWSPPMPTYGIPRRSLAPQAKELAPFNWRRGVFRIWLLLSVGWILSWTNYLIMYFLQGQSTGNDFLVIPVLLLGPPVALLIFGIAARWTFRGFQVIESSVATRSPEAA